MLLFYLICTGRSENKVECICPKLNFMVGFCPMQGTVKGMRCRRA